MKCIVSCYSPHFYITAEIISHFGCIFDYTITPCVKSVVSFPALSRFAFFSRHLGNCKKVLWGCLKTSLLFNVVGIWQRAWGGFLLARAIKISLLYCLQQLFGVLELCWEFWQGCEPLEESGKISFCRNTFHSFNWNGSGVSLELFRVVDVCFFFLI